jgi:drug/metabolite transporter (DMT)-like permease
VDIEKIIAAFRTPQGAVSALAAIVAVLGTVGILNSGMTTALQGLLSAILAVVVAAGHTVASGALVRRAIRRTHSQQ